MRMALAMSEFYPDDLRSSNPATAMKLNMVDERTTDGENPVIPAKAQSDSKMRKVFRIRKALLLLRGLVNQSKTR
jgi:hypothetical protein